MNKKIVFLLLVPFFASASFSAEKYEAIIKSQNNKGKEKVFTFSLTLDDPKSEQISGEIMSYGSGPCGKERKITGTQKPDGDIEFSSEEGELKGCGKLVFRGRWDGSASIVGKMRFQGEDKEFIFKKWTTIPCEVQL